MDSCRETPTIRRLEGGDKIKFMLQNNITKYTYTCSGIGSRTHQQSASVIFLFHTLEYYQHVWGSISLCMDCEEAAWQVESERQVPAAVLSGLQLAVKFFDHRWTPSRARTSSSPSCSSSAFFLPLGCQCLGVGCSAGISIFSNSSNLNYYSESSLAYFPNLFELNESRARELTVSSLRILDGPNVA